MIIKSKLSLKKIKVLKDRYILPNNCIELLIRKLLLFKLKY